eukprot:jgi/Chlat1/2844/Chrsp194S03000
MPPMPGRLMAAVSRQAGSAAVVANGGAVNKAKENGVVNKAKEEADFRLEAVEYPQWVPSAITALSASPDGAAVAVARESRDIEIWNVSGSWHLELHIPGSEGGAITSLAWCKEGVAGTRGRLFSAGHDAAITEWDLQALRPKNYTESQGGAVWCLAAQPVLSIGDEGQHLAIACEDGAVRLFNTGSTEVVNVASPLEFKRAFTRVQDARALSVAWHPSAERIYSGASDGCIRCWSVRIGQELLRITAGGGGVDTSTPLVWALQVLRDGTVVSGDSTGRTQFWDGQLGTLLQAQQRHTADVLALATSASGNDVFSAGVDGQVVMFSRLHNSGDATLSDAGAVREGEWAFVEARRAHSHDIRALTVATPAAPDPSTSSSDGSGNLKQRRNSLLGGRLVSGGNDAILTTYAVDGFASYRPQQVSSAPQPPPMHFSAPTGGSSPDWVLLSQHSTWLDVWRPSQPSGNAPMHASCSSNGHVHPPSVSTSTRHPQDLTCIKLSKVQSHICCSAVAPDGFHVACSDWSSVRLFQLTYRTGGLGAIVKKRVLPKALPAAIACTFSGDGSKLLLSASDCQIHVIHLRSETPDIVHTFTKHIGDIRVPIQLLVASRDGRWLVSADAYGRTHLFDLQRLKHHAALPLLDGTAVTALAFHPKSSLLAIATASSRVYLYNITTRKLHPWSQSNSSRFPRTLSIALGGIKGLAFCPAASSNKLFAYSSSASCLIDFDRPVPSEPVVGRKRKRHKHYQGHKQSKDDSQAGQQTRNFEIRAFRNPCLFLTFTEDKSVLVVDRPWRSVVRQFPPPLYRHRYGT